MCDFFWQRMEKDQGDLADIVRASGGRPPGPSDLPLLDDAWQLPPGPATFPSAGDDFGDPFAELRDPLLHELTGAAVGVFDAKPGGAEGGGGAAAGVTRPCNLFSRVLQISPGAAKALPLSPRAIKPSPAAAGDHGGGVQISSSPRAPGIKRRKGQAKKVVCIPAPAAATSSRPTGEVVPSDLWAWRKYGQKPIKGSPYPRGYYRCSSSKGCSARKQVERSRTDPNMLVITYTSEHNHPWPTQRNALAGSTRSQPSKSGASASKTSPHSQRPPSSLKEEPKEITAATTTTAMSSGAPTVKEEVGDHAEKAMVDQSSNDHEFDRVFYDKSMVHDSCQPDDFFADLAELDPDPMSLIFSTKGFMGDGKSDEERESKALDPFNMFDWGGSSSFADQAKRGL